VDAFWFAKSIKITLFLELHVNKQLNNLLKIMLSKLHISPRPRFHLKYKNVRVCFLTPTVVNPNGICIEINFKYQDTSHEHFTLTRFVFMHMPVHQSLKMKHLIQI